MPLLNRSIKKTIFLLGISMLCTSLYVPRQAGAQTTSADTIYKDAGDAYDHGDVDKAIVLYQNFVELEPQSVEGRTNLGVALAHVGRYDDAIVQYQNALKYDAKNPVVLLNLALARYKQADFAKAADNLIELRRAHPEGQQSLYLLADCYLRLGKNREAVTLLQPAYDANPDDRAVDYALGTALIRDGQIEKGEVIIDRILKKGDTADVNLLMGAAQLAAGDFKKASSTIRKALDMDPNLPGGWSLYGQALEQDGQPEQSVDAFRHALQIDPNDFDANLRLGALLRHDGNNPEAQPYLERALLLRPSSIPARFQVGAVHLALGKLDPARKDLEQVAHDSPDFQEVHVQLAALYARMGLTADSQREREIVLKLNEKSRAKGPQPDK